VERAAGYWTRSRKQTLNRRRLIALAASAGAAAGLAGCGGSRPKTGSGGAPSVGGSAQGTPQPGGTFVWYVNKNEVIDPQNASASDQQCVSGVYSRLFQFKTALDPKVTLDHELEPDLGVSAESPDAVTWTIKLRPDARFHNVAPTNGRPVDSDDIKATFTRAVDPATNNPNRGGLDMIDPAQIQTPDKNTVIFKLRYPYAPFRNELASPSYSEILPREVLTGAFDPAKRAVGSGPFIMESATPDVAYVYRRNPDYFVKGRPYVDGMKMAIIPDPSQQLAQFTAGNLDEIGTTGGQQFTAFDVDTFARSNPKAMMIKSANAIPNPIYFQLGDPTSPFLDIRVRQAFSMAIDREVLGKTVWGGQYEQPVFVPAYLGKWSLKVQDLDPKVQQYFKYNPAESKKLLEAAGATNLQIKLTWANSFGTPPFVKQAETIANFLNQVGVKTSLVVVDFNKDYIAGGKGLKAGYYAKDTVLLAAQSMLSESDEFLFNFFDSKSTSNNERLNDPAIDAMIDKERTLVNENERLKAVLDIQRYLAEKMYFVGTVGTYQWSFIQPRVQNYQYSCTVGRPAETYSKLWLKA
jgi:peptide/nickel transport system substrate-binding protein